MTVLVECQNCGETWYVRQDDIGTIGCAYGCSENPEIQKIPVDFERETEQ